MNTSSDSTSVTENAMASVSVSEQKTVSNAYNGQTPYSCGVYPEGIVDALPPADAASGGAARDSAPP